MSTPWLWLLLLVLHNTNYYAIINVTVNNRLIAKKQVFFSMIVFVWMNLYLFTLVACDHVTYLLEDMCQTCSACNFCILLSCRKSACAHRAWRLQRWELSQKYIWKKQHTMLIVQNVHEDSKQNNDKLEIKLMNCAHTWLDVAVVADDSSPACVKRQSTVLPLSLSVSLSLQKFLFLPHLLPIPQQKHSMFQHKVPKLNKMWEIGLLYKRLIHIKSLCLFQCA